MKSRLAAIGLASLMAVAFRVPAQDSPAVTIRLSVGEGEFVEGAASRLVVSEPDVLEAQVRDDRRGVNLIAKRSGNSDLTVIDPEGKERRFAVFVSGSSLEEDFAEVKQLVAEGELFGITVSKTQQSVVAKGSVYTYAEKRLWDSIKERFDLVDLVKPQIKATEVAGSLEEFRTQISGLVSDNEVLRAELIGLNSEDSEPTLWLRGLVLSEESSKQIDEVAQRYFGKILNQIEIQKPIVEINTSLVTVDYSKTRERGENEFFEQVSQVSVGGEALTRLAYTGTLGQSGADTGSNLNLIFLPEGADARIRARKSNSMGVTVRDSAVAVKSGERAELTEGGNIFFQQATEDAVDLVPVEVGLRIAVEPVVLKSGEIEMKIDIANTTADESSVAAGAVETRESSNRNTVRVRPGQTIVLAGVDSSTTNESTDGTPLLESVPGLNILFKSKSKTMDNQRTYFMLTPKYATIREAATKNLTAGAFDFQKFADDKAQFQKTGLGFWLGYEPDFRANPDSKGLPYGTLKRN